MAGEFLTPTSIWNNFSIQDIPSSQTIGEYREGDIILNRMRIEGRKCTDGQVSIYAVLAKKVRRKKLPTIFILQKFTDGADETLAMDLAKKGYCAFVVNIGGEDGVNTNHTLYPKSLSYANYKNAKNILEKDVINGDFTTTCYYEWGVTARYALTYLRSLSFVDKIAGLGIGDSATILWHLSATENFDALAFMLNAGWHAYKGNYKFLSKIDEQFSDEKINYLSGVEPQSYAPHIKAPTLIEVATNSSEFDFDRSHDTHARIKEEYFSAIHYTEGGINCVNWSAYENTLMFFKEFLIEKGLDQSLPHKVEIKCEIKDGECRVEVIAKDSNIKEIYLNASEEHYNPSLRQWQKVSKCKRKGESFVFKYLPYVKSGCVFFFATVVYKNGFIINSNVISKKFDEKMIKPSHKVKVIYSSREEDSESAFYPATISNGKPQGLAINNISNVVEKKGAMGIDGITCESGLLTFKMAMIKYRPQEDGILLIDTYMPNGGNVTVKLIANYFGEKIEYVAKSKVPSGEIWHNLKFFISNFKSPEGMAIRSIEKIQAMQINADDTYLVNNILWV